MAQLAENEQTEVYERLVLVRDSLHAVAGLDGPRDPKHIMYAEYASNTAIVIWTLVGFLLSAYLLYTISMRWSQATGTEYAVKIEQATAALQELEKARDEVTKADAAELEAQRKAASEVDTESKKEAQKRLKMKAAEAASRRAAVVEAEKNANLAAVQGVQAIRKGGATERSVLVMVILLGALGGSLHLVGSLVKYVGNRQLKRSWLLHYLSMPVMGAGLAPIVYLLLRLGILSPSGAASDGSTIAHLNLNAIYAFAALTGLFAKTATEKLSEVFRTLFRTKEPPSKDALGPETETAPGKAASEAPKSF